MLLLAGELLLLTVLMVGGTAPTGPLGSTTPPLPPPICSVCVCSVPSATIGPCNSSLQQMPSVAANAWLPLQLVAAPANATLALAHAQIPQLDNSSFAHMDAAFTSQLVVLDLSNIVLSTLTGQPFNQPEHPFSRLKRLTFSSSNLQAVPENSLLGLSALQHLDISYTFVYELAPASLRGLDSLRVLLIGPSFAFSMLSGPVFQYTPQLEQLFAAQVSLLDLPPATMASAPGLTTLTMSSSGLRALAPSTFASNSQLTMLYLQGNGMVEIGSNAFSGCSALEQLFLNHNHLTSLDDATVFHGLPSLQILELSDNHLSVLATGLFANLPSLTQLELSNNRLTRLPLGLFSQQSFFNTGFDFPFVGWNFPVLFVAQVQQSSVQFQDLGGLTPPFLSLGSNPWRELNRAVFAPLPALVSVLLLNPIPPYGEFVLDSCCGTEFLLTSTQFVLGDNVLCKYPAAADGSPSRLASFQGKTICPCLQKVLPPPPPPPSPLVPDTPLARAPKLFVNSLANCTALAHWRLSPNGTCTAMASCPEGSRLAPLNRGDDVYAALAGVCSFYDDQFSGNISVFLYESKCELCSVVGCALCPGDDAICVRCSAGFFLYRGTCLQQCPGGFVGASVDDPFSVPGGSADPAGPEQTAPVDSCVPCQDPACAACSAPTVCTACVSQAYELTDFGCRPCRDVRCADCSKNAETCQTCDGSLLVSLDGTQCVTSCPPGTQVCCGAWGDT